MEEDKGQDVDKEEAAEAVSVEKDQGELGAEKEKEEEQKDKETDDEENQEEGKEKDGEQVGASAADVETRGVSASFVDLYAKAGGGCRKLSVDQSPRGGGLGGLRSCSTWIVWCGDHRAVTS